jgi:Methyltransferase domain
MALPHLRQNDQRKGLEDFYASIHNVGKLTAVEVGCFRGESAEIAARYVKHLWCVDPWSPACGVVTPFDGGVGQHEYMLFLLKTAALDNIRGILRMTSVEAGAMMPDKSLDIVYLDGLHDYANVKQDILTWLPKLRMGGYLGGHDFNDCPDHIGLLRAVREILGEPPEKFLDGSWKFRVTEALGAPSNEEHPDDQMQVVPAERDLGGCLGIFQKAAAA